MITNELRDAYRWYRQTRRSGKRQYAGLHAVECLAAARIDVAAGKRRYPSEDLPAVTWQRQPVAHDAIGTWSNPFPAKTGRLAFVNDPVGAGLRYVGRASIEGRRGAFSSNESEGWFTDPFGDVFKDGSGLCWGVVYQLPGRGRKSRFVAGYIMGGYGEDLPTVDLGTIYEGESDYGNPKDSDAAYDAARAADSMAQKAAETEREYQTAWQAGTRYADAGAEIAAERKKALELLAERRRARSIGKGFDAICATIRAAVESSVETIAELREKRAKLMRGDLDELSFYPSPELRAAFNEGAGEAVI